MWRGQNLDFEDKVWTNIGQGLKLDKTRTNLRHKLDKFWTWDKLWTKPSGMTFSGSTEYSFDLKLIRIFEYSHHSLETLLVRDRGGTEEPI